MDFDDKLNPFEVFDPKDAYFFLSDDAQDELSGMAKRKLKCLLCGHKFMGETFNACPVCFSMILRKC